MPIRVYLLQAPCAVAAGTTIQQNVKRFGKLPAAIEDEYDRWLATHSALDSALAEDIRAHEIDPALDRAIVAPSRPERSRQRLDPPRLVRLDAGPP